MSVSGACGIPAYQPHHQQAQIVPPNHQMYQMDQNPTTSHMQHHQQHQQQQQQQQWHYGQHQEGAQTQYRQPQQERPQYPRSPSRSVGPAESQTAIWMNQHYMNGGNWAYSASPVPSIAPSVISQSQYPADDRMSMLSVNTAITGQGDVETQRCFSSNGSTQENINPDMAFAHLMHETDFILNNWTTMRDPQKRYECSTKLYLFLKNQGLHHLDDTVKPHYVHQFVKCITDGLVLWTPRDVPPPREYMQLAARLFEVFHKLVQNDVAFPIVAAIFSQTEGERSLKELLCPFIRVTQDGSFDRFVFIVLEFICAVLNSKNEENLKVRFLKSLKCPSIVHALIRHLNDAPIPNVNILLILRYIISRDEQMKEYIIGYQFTKKDASNSSSAVRIILDRIFPRGGTFYHKPPIIHHACHLLRTLLHDAKSTNDFVKLNGVFLFCNYLRQVPDPRLSKEVFNLFLHVSHSPTFQEVDIPLSFILHMIHNYRDEDFIKLGTGFLSNIVANKPKFKNAAIQNDAIQLLDSILSKIPRVQDVNDGRKTQLLCEVMSNCLRTLINLLPFWMQNSQMITDQTKHSQIVATVNKLIDVQSFQRYMSYLSCDVNNHDISNFIEVRSHILRFIGIVVRMPFVGKQDLLGITDEIRKENIIGHILHTYSWASQLYQQLVTDQYDKEQREKLVERAIGLIVTFMDYCNAEIQVASQCRYVMTCPFELLRDARNESFIRVILEFCDKIAMHCDDILTIWNFDRAMMEGLTNNRNANIAKSANSLLSRVPAMSSEPLADVFANTDFY